MILFKKQILGNFFFQKLLFQSDYNFRRSYQLQFSSKLPQMNKFEKNINNFAVLNQIHLHKMDKFYIREQLLKKIKFQ